MSCELSIDTLGNSELDTLYHSSVCQPSALENAGVDIFCPETITIPPKSLAFTIDFKIVCCCNNGASAYYLIPRSSISKTPLRMSNSIGLIDKGYRGHIMAKVDNLSDSEYTIKAGERLFQICLPSLERPVINFETISTDTIRGTGGFGSTGK